MEFIYLISVIGGASIVAGLVVLYLENRKEKLQNQTL
jgi:hypothetical protein